MKASGNCTALVKARQALNGRKSNPSKEQPPPFLRAEYTRITNELENISASLNWWKEERSIETHIDAFALYDSRCVEIDESQVMMDSLRLIDVLNEVQNYTSKVHGCYVNTINQMYLSAHKA